MVDLAADAATPGAPGGEDPGRAEFPGTAAWEAEPDVPDPTVVFFPAVDLAADGVLTGAPGAD